jgi:hypothetical protein
VFERHALAVVALVAAASAHPLCNLLFRCGCGVWSAAHCNVHHAVGPRCPWCTAPWHFAAAVAGWLAATVLGIWLARRRFGRRTATTLAGAFGGFAVGVLGSGVVTVLLTGYPYLFVR